MYISRLSLVAGLLLAFTPALAFAQPAGGNLISGLDPDADSSTFRVTSRTEDEVETVRDLTADGELSADDFAKALESAGNSVSPREMEVMRLALSGKVPGGPDFDVPEETLEAAVDLLYVVNLFPETVDELADGLSLGDSDLPRSVKEVVATAKLNGAKAYDVNETDSDGELIYTHYPSLNPPTENMAWDWTEVTPAALAADLADTEEHLRVSGTESVTYNGSDVTVARYTVMSGGTGSISAAYDEAYHPVRRMMPHTLMALGYPATLDVEAVRTARSRSGHRWSSNVAILSDGSFHCLPAIRRHSSTSGLILTNPALARGHQLMWNGHIRVQEGVVTYIGTSGGIAKRAARGRDVIINPIPLLKAWGFQIRDGLQVVSEHGSARPQVSEERAIMFEEATP